MEVFPNWTTVPIVFFLIVLTYVLNRTFFRPLGSALEERHRRIEGARKEAEEIRKASQDRLMEFDKKMREARREADQLMAGARNQALGDKSALLSGKRQEAERMLSEAKEDIRQRAGEARRKLEEESHRFAYEIASQILKRSVPPKKSMET